MTTAASPASRPGLGTPLAAAAVEQRLAGIITPTGLAVGGLLGLAFVGLFYFFFWSQGRFSLDSGDWSHSFLVPIISVYLLYQRRREIAAAPVSVFWPGLLPIALGIPCYALFQVSSLANHMAQGWAMLLTLFGLVLLTCGPRLAQAAFLPIAYLVLGITISEKVMIEITFKLQLIASQGAYVLLNMLGVSTTVDGNTLTVTASDGSIYPLNVAEACSGMRMVIAFVALGVAVALVGVKHWWQRTALIILAVPVALLMNVIRVAVLGVATLVDPGFAAGQSHMLIGTLLLVPAFALYMGVVWALNRAVHDPSSPVAAPPPSGAWSPVRWSALKNPAIATALSLLTVAAVGLPLAVAAMGIHLRKLPIQAPGGRTLQAVPTETAHWVRIGADTVMKQEMVDELGTSNYVTRSYVEKSPPAGRPPRRLELHMAYYTGQIDTVPHVSERCMTGAGFTIATGSQSVRVPLDRDRLLLVPEPDTGRNGQILTARHDDRFSEFRGQRIRMPRGVEDLRMRTTEFAGPKASGSVHIGYFFIANGGIAENAEQVRLLAFDLRDDYSYYLKVQIQSVGAQSPQELADAAGSLLSDLLPEIMRCAPDWVAVERGEYPDDNPRRGKDPRR
ncbi:MAG: exosortase/archaeosortase family protein [Phycisphaeraceae bacterium]|nr:exosortase/archaeosortase family protein [Phycisphaeraceae bacterium]